MTAGELRFHHHGLAVVKPEKAVRFLTSIGYLAGEPIRDELQNVHLLLATHPVMPAVEIVYPTETPGPLTQLLAQKTAQIYHTCYECDDLTEAVAGLKADGNRILPVVPPKPAVLFGGRLVAFYQVAGFGLIELLEAKI